MQSYEKKTNTQIANPLRTNSVLNKKAVNQIVRCTAFYLLVSGKCYLSTTTCWAGW